MSKRESKHADDDDSGKDDSDEDISDSGSDEDEDSSEEDLSESDDDRKVKDATKASVKTAGSERALVNQPFDEAMDLSESEGSIASEDPNSPKKQPGGGKTFKNQPFDEALELSESVQEVESPKKTSTAASEKPSSTNTRESKTAASGAVGNETKNKPFDEEVDLSDSGDSVDTNGQPSPKARQDTKNSQPVPAAAPAARQPPQLQSESKKIPEIAAAPAPKPAAAAPEKRVEPARKPAQESASSSEDSESGDEDDDDEEEDDDEGKESQSTSHAASAAAPHASSSAGSGTASGGGSSNHAAMMANAGVYKESDYAHLKVSHEIRELFQYIGRFKAQEIELETRLKCFIPEYIPAVGDMDAFLKVPRPDGQADQLGLKMLDEPSLNQSDATVLDLQLRSTSKKKHGDIVVRSIENAEKSPREIDRWIKSIADLHRTKPPPQVHYTKTMPDIESLMQVWPEEFEELLSKTTLPSADLDMGLEQYVRVICALLDIPVHKNVYESLHVLFTLYLEFRSNQHFMPLL